MNLSSPEMFLMTSEEIPYQPERKLNATVRDDDDDDDKSRIKVE